MDQNLVNDVSEPETIEEIKSRYRKEALRAIDAAENKAFESGKSEGLKTADLENKRLKAIIESMTSYTDNESSQRPQQLLLKFIMEHIYREVKKEWNSSDEISAETIHRMKSVLVRITSELMNDMPKIYVAPKPLLKSCDTNDISIEPQYHIGRKISIVKFAAIPLVFKAFVDIPSASDFSLKGRLFAESNCILYSILTNFSRLSPQIRNMGSPMHATSAAYVYEQKKLYSEFQTLYQHLVKENSKCLIPSLPADSASSVVDEVNTKISQTRLSLWLNYLLLNGKTQLNERVIAFFTGSTTEGGGVVAAFLEQHELRSNDMSPLSSPHNDDIEFDCISQDHINKQEMKKIQRELLNIEPRLFEVQSSVREWMTSRTVLSKVITKFHSKLQSIIDFETKDSWEYFTWTTLKAAFEDSGEVNDLHIATIQGHLYEPVSFFGSTCLDRARNMVNHVKTFVMSEKNTNKEKEETTKNLAQEWDAYKNIKSELTMHNLVKFSSKLSNQHRTSASVWESAAASLRALNADIVSPSFRGDIHKAVADEFVAFEDYRKNIATQQSEHEAQAHAHEGVRSRSFCGDDDPLWGDGKNPVDQGQLHAHVNLSESVEGLVQSRRHKSTSAAAAAGASGGGHRRLKAKGPTHTSFLDESVKSTLRAESALAQTQGESSEDDNEEFVEAKEVEAEATETFVYKNNNSYDSEVQDAHTHASSVHIGSRVNTSGSKQAPPLPPLPDLESEEALPEGWEKVHTEDGRMYYFHIKTRLSRWEKPSHELAAALDLRLEEENKQVEENLRRRKMEQDQSKEQESHKARVNDQIQEIVKDVVNSWAFSKGLPRSLSEMLNLLPTVTQLVPENIFGDVVFSDASPPSDIKKGYMRVVRIIHPDKLSASLDLEQKILAEAIFVALSASYEMFRAKHS